MKKLFLAVLISFFLPSFLFSQCLPEGIIFYSQAQIDSFKVDYENCTEIEGDVSIGHGYPTDITNLDGLDELTSIGGYLDINSHVLLTSLIGLEELVYVGGDLIIFDNESISSLNGLNGLITVGGDLSFYENPNIVNFSGLDELTSIEGRLDIGHNPSLISLIGFVELTSTGGLSINYVHNISDLTGLNFLTYVGGYIGISSCEQLTSLEGLNSLATVVGNFNINSEGISSLSALGGLTSSGGLGVLNLEITNLSGLNALTSITGTLYVGGCDLLTSLSGLDSLTHVGEELKIGGNTILTSLSGIDNIDYQSITKLNITYNPALSTCEVKSVCDYLAAPGGDIFLFSNSDGCNSPEEVEAACNNLSTEVNDDKSELLIYPNPAKNKLFINTRNETTINELVIYNQIGQVVFKEIGVVEFIDISELKQGIYVIEININNKKIKEKLIIE
ncbi:MAG: T9SS type A sorting domain-containing protein [Bacteroidota bacterium]